MNHDKVVSIIAGAANGAAPDWAPFRMVPRYVKVCCHAPGYEGFCAEVRDNLSNAEREAFQAAADEIAAYAEAQKKLAAADQEPGWQDELIRRELDLIAPYVRAWNVEATDAEDGAVKPLPAPADGGPAVFGLLDPPMTTWLRMAVIKGFLTGTGVGDFATAWRRVLAGSLAEAADAETTTRTTDGTDD